MWLIGIDEAGYGPPARGLGELEKGVLGTVAGNGVRTGSALGHYVDWIAPAYHAELRAEPWYHGQTDLPVKYECCGPRRFFLSPRPRQVNLSDATAAIVHLEEHISRRASRERRHWNA